MVISALVLSASALALVVPWSTDTTASFSGSICGDVSKIILLAPPNTFAVSVKGPRRGAKLRDATTGKTVATITSVRRTAQGVTYSATGTEDVCTNPDGYANSGWKTKPIHFHADFKANARLLYPSACNNPSYRPGRVVVACGSSAFYIDGIRWSSWSDRGAAGAGTAHVNDCKPSCASGRFRSYPGVDVHLGSFQYCGAHRDYEFTELEYRFTRSRPAGYGSSGFGPRGCASR
jgi:hypothetical protein